MVLMTIAHAGAAGHRGVESTKEALVTHFMRKGMCGDIQNFVDECLLCLLPKSGSKVSRPLSTTLHAIRPSEILHFDYMFIGSSDAGDMYVLVLKDDLSGYCSLAPSIGATAEQAAEVPARWIRTFPVPQFLVSN